MPKIANKKIKRFSGVVVSDKMDKTIVVQVVRFKRHPKYIKTYRAQKKYKVHDPQEKFKIGDKVEFVPCRPISKEKRWRVVYE